MLFRAGLAAVLPLDDEGAEFVAIDFREHDVDIGKAAVGDEHLFAVEHVMAPIVTQLCRRLGGHRVRAGAGFSQRVRGD